MTNTDTTPVTNSSQFATSSYTAHQTGQPAPHIGIGIGLGIALLMMQWIGSLCQHHFFYRAMSTGVLLRGGLITAIYSRSLRLTSRARSTLTNGKLVNHISSDVSRIDFCAGYFHMVSIRLHSAFRLFMKLTYLVLDRPDTDGNLPHHFSLCLSTFVLGSLLIVNVAPQSRP